MTPHNQDVPFFDALRGWAAVAVFAHHAAILGGGPGFLRGDLGQESVNAFMMASGFLIYYQACVSKTYEGLRTRAGITSFYIRRFFRIATLYYAALAVALLMAPYLGEGREQIAQIIPSSATSMDRYYIHDIPLNALLHATFLFGFLPGHAFSTPLPDWSLGLEMQFYAIFPLLFFLFRNAFIRSLCVIAGIMFCIEAGLYAAGIVFPMPSLLFLKFQNFAAGIAIAHLYLNKDMVMSRKLLVMAVGIIVLVNGNMSAPMPLLFLCACWLLIFHDRITMPLRALANRILDWKIHRFLADMSYAVYLIHLLLMIPYFAHVAQPKPSIPEWALQTGTLFAAVILLAMLAHYAIEKPGIHLGKMLVDRWGKGRPVAPQG